MVSIAVAFIYGMTQSFMNGAQGAAGASDDLLGVTNARGRTQSHPMAAPSRIAANPDIAAIGYITRLRGFVEVEKNIMAVSANDPHSLMAVNGHNGVRRCARPSPRQRPHRPRAR